MIVPVIREVNSRWHCNHILQMLFKRQSSTSCRVYKTSTHLDWFVFFYFSLSHWYRFFTVYL